VLPKIPAMHGWQDPAAPGAIAAPPASLAAPRPPGRNRSDAASHGIQARGIDLVLRGIDLVLRGIDLVLRGIDTG